MKLLTGITLICICMKAQPQNIIPVNQLWPQYRSSNPESMIYFPKENVQPSQSVINQIFGNPSRQNNVVEVEKSNEISATTTIEQVPGRLSSATAASNGQATQQFQPNRHNVQPITPDGQISQAAAEFPPPSRPVTPNQSGYNDLLYSITNFGVNLLKNINSQQSGNVVFSPYSITSLLALLQQGSSGQTQEQITTALQMNPTASASAYSRIANDYKNRNTRNLLKTANNVFVGETFVINRNFKKVAQKDFDSDITPIAFGKSDKAAGQINNWVASKTNNKIDRLISPDSIDSTTQLMLVNAVYFKGIWEVPFKVDATVQRDFNLNKQQKKRTAFMRTKRSLRSGFDRTNNARVVMLPFEREEYSLMVILPSVNRGMSGTLRTLTDARLLSYLSFPLTEIELELPKFTVKAETDLATVLRNMGLTNMFGPYAELNGLGTYQAFTPQISSAVHSAVLSIDEQGGSAAAATSFAAVALSYEDPTNIFKVNRPFIAVLWDSTTSLPLFIAKIDDPQV